MTWRNRIKTKTRLARQSFHERGFSGFKSDLRNYIAYDVLQAKTDFTQQRFRLSNRLSDELGDTVKYGPFEGLHLSAESWWSGADRGVMLLGMYEQEVLLALQNADRKFGTLVDVGAADGYYALGCLKAGWVSHAYCYEMSATGREAIARNAARNGLTDQVTILAEAKPGFFDDLLTEFGIDPASTLLIMDVEGAEQSLLAERGLESLHSSFSIIELHEECLPTDFVEDVMNRAESYGLSAELVTTQQRDPSEFLELHDWSDDDRWMLCSEGRSRLMRWLILSPTHA
jgi:hypothetical protein